jgi:hypothetical protein
MCQNCEIPLADVVRWANKRNPSILNGQQIALVSR